MTTTAKQASEAQVLRIRFRGDSNLRLGPDGQRFCHLEDGRIILRVPANAKLSLRKGLRWETLYDGSKIQNDDLKILAEKLDFSMSELSVVRVVAGRNRWTVSSNEPQLRRPVISTSNGLGLVASLLLHLLTFGTVWFAGHETLKDSGSVDLGSQPVALRAAEAPALPAHYQFHGISLSKFLSYRSGKARSEVADLNALSQILSRTKLRGPVGGPANNSVDHFISGALKNSGTSNGGALLGAVRAETTSDVKGSAKLSPEDVQKVRAIFDGLQSAFSEAYSVARSRDATLDVTVSYQVTVGPTGHLTHIQLAPKGKGSSDSVQMLREAMTKILQGVKLDSKISGAIVKGQSVFRK